MHLYRWYSLDVTTAILVHRTKEKREFDSIIMQNRSHNLLLFGAPTWPSYHVIENYLLDTRAIMKKFNFNGEVTPDKNYAVASGFTKGSFKLCETVFKIEREDMRYANSQYLHNVISHFKHFMTFSYEPLLDIFDVQPTLKTKT